MRGRGSTVSQPRRWRRARMPVAVAAAAGAFVGMAGRARAQPTVFVGPSGGNIAATNNNWADAVTVNGNITFNGVGCYLNVAHNCVFNGALRMQNAADSIQ